ncbi:MAG TPA: nucleotide pyrophosphatase/phosphodiesterase family protein [Microlunatus sp.]|nr:nucleotide pyrophosphatase/phosphodiesterase family protein [Microlunatus sp.]
MIIPAYGSSSIADLLPSLGAHLGVPGCSDVLGLPEADRYVVVLVDGLGWQLLRDAALAAPYLASLLADGRSITAGVPSTTVTSLASLGTGLPPGQHGMVGYTSRVPSTGEILNALTWESDLVAQAYQSKSTMFERAVEAGVRVSSVALERFESSGLTQAGLRGPDFVGYADERATEIRIALTVEAAGRGERSLVYAYERELDHTGHVEGCGSRLWRRHLGRVDRMLGRLREVLPDDVVLIVTGDHGMVDVPPWHQIIVEDTPELLAGLDALAGEGRFRQLYVDREPVAAVAARWTDRLGDKAWVRTRTEAVEEGWFGPVDPDLVERWGHVLVALRTDWAVMTQQFPRELSLVGMHGSLTEAEMTVPLLIG